MTAWPMIDSAGRLILTAIGRLSAHFYGVLDYLLFWIFQFSRIGVMKRAGSPWTESERKIEYESFLGILGLFRVFCWCGVVCDVLGQLLILRRRNDLWTAE